MVLLPQIRIMTCEEFNLSYIPDLIDLKVAGTEKEKIKKVDLEFHRQEYERLSNKLSLSSEQSHLPDLPTAKDALNDLLVRIRLN